jgi:hypothetical protein
MEEVVILDNLEVFRQNGFRFLVDEEAPPMKRLQVSGHFSHGGAEVLCFILMACSWLFSAHSLPSPGHRLLYRR